jgi:hypothetical protein
MKTLKICLVILCLLHFRAVGLPQLDGANFFMENEVWSAIKGYENSYQVSSLGRVKSLSRIVFRGNGNHARKIREKILVATPDSAGYPTVKLPDRTYTVHSLVAKAFLPNPHNLPQVNHKNRIKKDCYVDNLEWCTVQQNIVHSFKVGTRKDVSGQNNPAAKYNDSIIDKVKQEIKICSSNSEIAKKYGVSRQLVYAIRTGRRRQ